MFDWNDLCFFFELQCSGCLLIVVKCFGIIYVMVVWYIENIECDFGI